MPSVSNTLSSSNSQVLVSQAVPDKLSPVVKEAQSLIAAAKRETKSTEATDNSATQPGMQSYTYSSSYSSSYSNVNGQESSSERSNSLSDAATGRFDIKKERAFNSKTGLWLESYRLKDTKSNTMLVFADVQEGVYPGAPTKSTLTLLKGQVPRVRVLQDARLIQSLRQDLDDVYQTQESRVKANPVLPFAFPSLLSSPSMDFNSFPLVF